MADTSNSRTDHETETHAALSDRPLTATLLRRLAEAADPVNEEAPFWIVSSFAPVAGNFQIVGTFFDKEEADDAVPDPAQYGVFGPFQGSPGKKPTPIRKLKLEVDGINEDVHLMGHRFDALFWSESALRKFALPYYANLSGVEYAMRLRDEFRAPDAYLMAHDPDTEYRMFKVSQTGKVRII